MKNLTTTSSIVAQVYNSETTEGKKAIERLYGADALVSIVNAHSENKYTATKRPIGVWCFGADGSMTTAHEWDKDAQARGVLVVTDHTAFIVAPNANAALQWGAMGSFGIKSMGKVLFRIAK